MGITTALVKIIPQKHHNLFSFAKGYIFKGYGIKSYSQDGIDVVLRNTVFDDGKPIFYVDVGAHHPHRFSNTFLFYKEGGRGINIDATPNSMRLFNICRSRDINIECAISDKKVGMNYLVHEDSALNGFSTDNCPENSQGIFLFPKTLFQIFMMYPNEVTVIDLLTIDTEGHDFNVLKSNDWDIFKPKVIVVESGKDDGRIEEYLRGKGYLLSFYTPKNLCFRLW